MSDDLWFEQIADATPGEGAERAPARLKSKIYSALLSRMTESGPLLDLAETKSAGGRLCIFENAVAVLPVSAEIRSLNVCRVCHARVLGERMEKAPIFLPGCPYSEFHKS
jgi:hypothetical protein